MPTATNVQHQEIEPNNDKPNANVLNVGTATSFTISGTSANSNASEADYFRINTSYSTPGIYLNQIQLGNGTQNIGRIRGFSQADRVVDTASNTPFQTSSSSGTAMPYGLNQYYAFGGAGKTQSVYYTVTGASAGAGGAYTAICSTHIATISTRRFLARPASSVLAATGAAMPTPTGMMLPATTP